VSGEGARYRFGPRERGGALAGWRAGQILTVALGLVVGVLILRAEPNVDRGGSGRAHPRRVRGHGHLAPEWADG
jgi:predicted MFS family arabinose efflux permease